MSSEAPCRGATSQFYGMASQLSPMDDAHRPTPGALTRCSQPNPLFGTWARRPTRNSGLTVRMRTKAAAGIRENGHRPWRLVRTRIETVAPPAPSQQPRPQPAQPAAPTAMQPRPGSNPDRGNATQTRPATAQQQSHPAPQPRGISAKRAPASLKGMNLTRLGSPH